MPYCIWIYISPWPDQYVPVDTGVPTMVQYVSVFRFEDDAGEEVGSGARERRMKEDNAVKGEEEEEVALEEEEEQTV